MECSRTWGTGTSANDGAGARANDGTGSGNSAGSITASSHKNLNDASSKGAPGGSIMKAGGCDAIDDHSSDGVSGGSAGATDGITAHQSLSPLSPRARRLQERAKGIKSTAPFQSKITATMSRGIPPNFAQAYQNAANAMGLGQGRIVTNSAAFFTK
jgi:hypothetical protein